jgi:adenine phosphoribosyltransferase
MTDTQKIKAAFSIVPDFPKPGISFVDFNSVLANENSLQLLFNALLDTTNNEFPKPDKIVGLESRGFFLGASLALRLGIGFIPIRKKGKLPPPVIEESYEKEYGLDTIEVNQGLFKKDEVVVLHDDVLATGGTLLAAANLVSKCVNKNNIYFLLAVELDYLNGRQLLIDAGFKSENILSIVHFNE